MRLCGGHRYFALKLGAAIAALVVAFFASFWIGTYPASPDQVLNTLVGKAGQALGTVSLDAKLDNVVWNVRFPRIVAAILVGGALSTSGASYQTVFKNPMVSPDILGVSAGASFGAALVMLMQGTWWQIQVGAFVFGVIAVSAAYVIGSLLGKQNITILVLAGMVISSLFQALVSILKTMADTDSVLPEITYWLMGSLHKADLEDVAVLLPAIIVSLALLFVFRHQINALAAGEEEAASLGVNVGLTKGVVIGSATLMTVCAVSVCGIIGWVGLVVPHIARNLVGSSYGKLAASSFVIGGIFLLIIDDIIRGAFGVDLPLGVMTALVGTPVFLVLLARSRKAWA